MLSRSKKSLSKKKQHRVVDDPHRDYIKLEKSDGRCICTRFCGSEDRCKNHATVVGFWCKGCSNQAHGKTDCGC